MREGKRGERRRIVGAENKKNDTNEKDIRSTTKNSDV